MPVLDGCAATKRLRYDPATAQIPVVAVRANAEWAARPSGLFDAWLEKPATPARMLEVLKAVMQRA